MKVRDAQDQFIQTWGTLGTQWGINRTMAQIHALLLLSPKSLTTDDIMERLSISRGNANMNIRGLIDWGIVKKDYKPGERKDFFFTDKDVHKLARQVMKERRRREIEPVINILDELTAVEVGESAEGKEFKQVTTDLNSFVKQADKLAEFLSKSDKNWFLGTLMKLVK